MPPPAGVFGFDRGAALRRPRERAGPRRGRPAPCGVFGSFFVGAALAAARGARPTPPTPRRRTSAGNGPPCAGTIVVAPASSSVRQPDRTGRGRRRRSAPPARAASGNRSSPGRRRAPRPLGSSTLTDPAVWPGVGITRPATPNGARSSPSSPIAISTAAGSIGTSGASARRPTSITRPHLVPPGGSGALPRSSHPRSGSRIAIGAPVNAEIARADPTWSRCPCVITINRISAGTTPEPRERPPERPGLAGHAGVHQHRALAPDEGAARHPEPDRIDPHAHRRAP